MVNSIARKEITIKMPYWFRFSQKILVDLGFRKNCASFDFWTWVNTDLNFPIPKLTLHVLLLRVRSRAYVASTKFNLILRSLLTTFLSNLILKLARNEAFHLFLQTWHEPLITEQNLAGFCSPATIYARNCRLLTCTSEKYTRTCLQDVKSCTVK